METKELKIEIPIGYEIDKDKSTFEKIVFKKKDTKPRSWEEYCKNHEGDFYYITNDADIVGLGYDPGKMPLDVNKSKNVLPSKELAKAFLAMMQLMSLRHEWIHQWSIDNGMTNDWKFDWNDNKYKYCIIVYNNEYIIKPFSIYHGALFFPTEEIAKDFMNCFKDLLEL